MTIQEMKALQQGYPPFFSSGYVTDNFQHHFVQPIPIDQMAHFKQDVPDTQFNGMSLEQCAALDQYKNMDKLHQADAVAKDLKRSERLFTEFNEIGKESFISRRLNKT